MMFEHFFYNLYKISNHSLNFLPFYGRDIMKSECNFKFQQSLAGVTFYMRNNCDGGGNFLGTGRISSCWQKECHGIDDDDEDKDRKLAHLL